MKQAFIVSPKGISDAGGVERVMRYAARSLEAAGYRVVVVDRERLLASIWGRRFARLIGGRFGFFFEAIGYALFLGARKEEGDLVVGNGHSCAFYSADLLFSHGSMRGFQFAIKGRRWRYGPEEVLEAAAGQMARRVVAVSARAAGEWHKFYKVKKEKIRVLRNCVDTGHFRPRAADSSAAETRAVALAESSEPALRVLFVGRLGFAKGADRLVALARQARRGGARVDIVAASPTAAGTEVFGDDAEIKLMVGVAFADLPELYNSCDVMYLPSRYEGFEMVTTEALACGLPVVGSGVGAIAELARIGFPGVRVVDADKPETVLPALQATAKDWASAEKKRFLAASAEKSFGLKAWSEAFASLVREAADE